jgi:4-hydroxybenzoate polyprenyltransferase
MSDMTNDDKKPLSDEAAEREDATDAFADDAPDVQAESEEQKELTVEAAEAAAEDEAEAPAELTADDAEPDVAEPAPETVAGGDAPTGSSEGATSASDATAGAAAGAAAGGTKPADAVRSAIMDRLPEDMGPYLSLSRFDRPIGFWLLALPCFIGLAFTRIQGGWQWMDIIWLVLFAIGAVAMRGAGCTWNDIQDRHIDAQVERTRARPIPSGQIKLSEAWMWLGIQLVVGFLVWVCLPLDAKIVALLAIPLVAAYPFMKRVTWWPQAWLGATFSWGALVAAATASSISLSTVILFLGLACWVVAYDTIYAIADREDDELVGVKSTARLFEGRTGLAVFGFFVAATVLIALAAAAQGAGRIGAITALVFLGHGTWQVLRLRRDREARAIEVFRSNTGAGIILFLGLAVAALFGYGKGAAKAEDAPAPVAAEPAPEADADRPWWMAEPAGEPAPAPTEPRRSPFGFVTPTPGEDDPQPDTAPAPQPEAQPTEQPEPREEGGFNPFGGMFGGGDTDEAPAPDEAETPAGEADPE